METENDLCYFHITMSHILAILGYEVIGSLDISFYSLWSEILTLSDGEMLI